MGVGAGVARFVVGGMEVEWVRRDLGSEMGRCRVVSAVGRVGNGSWSCRFLADFGSGRIFFLESRQKGYKSSRDNF